MHRNPITGLLAALLALAALAMPPREASAQPVAPKAYAPEDLSRLSVSDRIRVIEREYQDQSGGRQIADDQLEFYLDQVQYSRWSFSQIKADIATSLRGSRGPWRPVGNWNQRSVICSSKDRRYFECAAPFRGRARVVQQISDTRCIEDNNWGQRRGMIWVDRGCRARFGEDPARNWDNDGNFGNGQRITCESREGRYRECRTNFRGQARLFRQLSSSACVVGRDWGSRPGQVWVDNGCRAEFTDSLAGNNGTGRGQGNSGYSVTCASENGRYRTCAWDSRGNGRPRLLEQLSNQACIEGRTWGYDPNRGLWVDQGCRARFGSR
jgi:hypothetical protein